MKRPVLKEEAGAQVTRPAELDAAPDGPGDDLPLKQEALRAFVESISSELELRPLLDLILQHACVLAEADCGALGLVDGSRTVVRLESVCRLSADMLGSEYGLGEGVPGLVLERAETVVLDDYQHYTDPDAQLAAMGVPISYSGDVIGTLGVARGGEPGQPAVPFGARETRTLEVFARHAAIAIENARRYLREQERGERLALIARIGNLITANVGLDEMLRRAADAMHDLLGYSTIGIGLLENGDPPVLSIGAMSGERTYEFSKPYRLPITRGVMGACARERRAILVEDVTTDPRYVPVLNAVGIKCSLALPILLGNEVLGVLNVESDEPFDDEDPVSLAIVADQLAVAIEAAKLYEAGQELAALQERQKLSRELHDSVTQHLFGTVMLAESLSEIWATDPTRGARRTQRLLELSRSALAEMRALLGELMGSEPTALASRGLAFGVQRVRAFGLVAALERLAEELAGRGLPVTVDAQGYVTQPQSHEETLYRIAQEALNNTLKHADASKSEVLFATMDGRVTLRVTDDGKGLSTPAEGTAFDSRLRMGMDLMRERAEALGGTLSVQSRPEGGVEVEVSLPAQEADHG